MSNFQYPRAPWVLVRKRGAQIPEGDGFRRLTLSFFVFLWFPYCGWAREFLKETCQVTGWNCGGNKPAALPTHKKPRGEKKEWVRVALESVSLEPPFWRFVSMKAGCVDMVECGDGASACGLLP